jgi:hypothetical protein
LKLLPKTNLKKSLKRYEQNQEIAMKKDETKMNSLTKITILFGLGYGYGLMLDYLLQAHTLVHHPHASSSSAASSIRSNHLPPEVWVSFSFGFASCFIGLVYPIFDIMYNIKFHSDWTKVLRCYGAFAGFNYAIPVSDDFLFLRSLLQGEKKQSYTKTNQLVCTV